MFYNVYCVCDICELQMIDKIIVRGEELKTLQGQDRLQYLVDLAKDVKPLSD